MTSLILAAVLGPATHTHGWACAGACSHDPTPSLLAAHQIVDESLWAQNQEGQKAPTVKKSNVKNPIKLLIYSRTAGFRHDSIEKGVGVFFDLAESEGLDVTWTEDKSLIKKSVLNDHHVIMFLNTTGDCVDPEGQADLEEFVEKKGGGYVGVHAAADTEYDWAWYGRLVGAYFQSHPHIQPAKIQVVDRKHPSTKHLSDLWTRTDEWYDYKALPPSTARILMKLDTSSYTGHKMGENHPTSWCQTIGKGRAFYTGGGHTRESYDEPDFRKHLLGAIRWAAKRENG